MKLDKLREFIIKYPNWEKYGILPPKGRFLNFADIAPERFRSTEDIAQLALEFTGSNIIRPPKDYVWREDVLGNKQITRQYNYTLYILQQSGIGGKRADTSGFLDDFTEWVTEEDIKRNIPMFGDDEQTERTYVDDGAKLTDVQSAFGLATVYAVKLHKIYTKIYESEEY